VDELMALVTEKTIARIEAAYRLLGEEPPAPSERGWGCPDDSLQLLSPATYERFVLPHHERIYGAMTDGKRNMHLCGRSMQHYRVLNRKLGISAIDGPGPFVDHAAYLAELGPDFAFSAQTDNSTLAYGSAGDIRTMMAKLLNPGSRRLMHIELAPINRRGWPRRGQGGRSGG